MAVANVADGDDEEEDENNPECPKSGSIIEDDDVAEVELKQFEVGIDSLTIVGVDQDVVANCRHSAPVCHIDGR